MGGGSVTDLDPQSVSRVAEMGDGSANSAHSRGQTVSVNAENLVIIGMMGTGKTTVGRRCAEVLGMRFVDTDAVIEEREGMSVPEIFNAKGEGAFRELERRIVAEFAAESGLVISAGGGTVLNDDNATALTRSGYLVGLKASAESILRRIGNVSHSTQQWCPDTTDQIPFYDWS